MYNYVKEYWQESIKALEKQIDQCKSQQESQEYSRKLEWMRQTDMAVVVSQEQNEIQTFQKWGLDILTHRTRIEKEDLDKKYKDPDSPLRIVFVCAMWLTGFDVKTLSCLYIDKPMKAHTLMQTIARANRVAEGKTNGLVVDYIGIVKALRKALADYTANTEDGHQGNDPTINKSELIEQVNQTIASATEFMSNHGFNINDLIKANSFEKLSMLQTAANAMCATIEIRKSFCTYATTLQKLWKYLDRDDIQPDMKNSKDAIEAIYKSLQKKRKHANITNLSVEINNIVNEYLNIDTVAAEPKKFDISGINFEILKREFAHTTHKNLLLKDIEELLQERLAQMMAANPSRVNFYQRYQQIIEDYNNEQNRVTIEKTFEDLMTLSEQLTDEEKRYVREGFDNDEQLSMYDVLFKENLSKDDIKKLKLVAKELLEKIKSLLATMDHPFDKEETRAVIDVTIRDYLWEQLPESYSQDNVQYYRTAVFQFIRDKYVA